MERLPERILALDVSSVAVGFAAGGNYKIQTAGFYGLGEKNALEDRLQILREVVVDLVVKNTPALVIIEAPVSNHRSSMSTIRALFGAAGVALEAVRSCGVRGAIMVQPDWWQQQLFPKKLRPAEWKTWKSDKRRMALKNEFYNLVIARYPHLEVLIGASRDASDAAGMLLSFLEKGHELM
jgi:hypothetical protein